MINKPSITTYMKTMTGLTLVELMVTLGVLAILVAVGLPRLQGMSAGSRISATVNTLAADIAIARSEAVSRNRNITITQAAGGWANGWTIDALAMPGLALEILSTRGAIPNGMTLLETNGISSIPYNSRGLNSSGVARIFTLCDTGKQPRVINISISGRYTTSIDKVNPLCP